MRKAKTDGKNWLAQLEEQDRERTGIRNLRIKYNKVFGYYFEVSNSYKNQVPDDYVRKQTLVNAERYTTAKLKELEDTILNAEDKLNVLEYDMFCKNGKGGGAAGRVRIALRCRRTKPLYQANTERQRNHRHQGGETSCRGEDD